MNILCIHFVYSMYSYLRSYISLNWIVHRCSELYSSIFVHSVLLVNITVHVPLYPDAFTHCFNEYSIEVFAFYLFTTKVFFLLYINICIINKIYFIRRSLIITFFVFNFWILAGCSSIGHDEGTHKANYQFY